MTDNRDDGTKFNITLWRQNSHFCLLHEGEKKEKAMNGHADVDRVYTSEHTV